MDGLNLIATWNEPFSLDGEELSYVIYVINTASGVQKEVTAVNTSRYVHIEPIGERDCAEYQFVVFSDNDYSRSKINISEQEHIPTGTIKLNFNEPMTFMDILSYSNIGNLTIPKQVINCRCII